MKYLSNNHRVWFSNQFISFISQFYLIIALSIEFITFGREKKLAFFKLKTSTRCGLVWRRWFSQEKMFTFAKSQFNCDSCTQCGNNNSKKFKLIVVGHVGRRMNWSAIGNQCQSHFDVCGLHLVVKELWLFSYCAGRLQCMPVVSLAHSLSCQLHCWTSSQGSHTKWTMFTNKASIYWFFFIRRCGCSYYFNNSTFMLLCTEHKHTHAYAHTRVG